MEKVVKEDLRISLPFNSPFETGLRSVALLVASYPDGLDLHRLVMFDHLVVHTEDVGGPESLHPPVPMRTAEILVRRNLVERGLLLMLSRGLVCRSAEDDGIVYNAGEFAETFLASLTSQYLKSLGDRSQWVIEAFGNLQDDEIRERTGNMFEDWLEQFQVSHKSLVGES